MDNMWLYEALTSINRPFYEFAFAKIDWRPAQYKRPTAQYYPPLHYFVAMPPDAWNSGNRWHRNAFSSLVSACFLPKTAGCTVRAADTKWLAIWGLCQAPWNFIASAEPETGVRNVTSLIGSPHRLTRPIDGQCQKDGADYLISKLSTLAKGLLVIIRYTKWK